MRSRSVIPEPGHRTSTQGIVEAEHCDQPAGQQKWQQLILAIL
jgi:hypothetical protein